MFIWMLEYLLQKPMAGDLDSLIMVVHNTKSLFDKTLFTGVRMISSLIHSFLRLN